jgi:uncharacterized protein YdhG (YjbR/CyaY superfamily)
MKKNKVPTNIDEYLATVSDEHRAALEKLRKQIRLAAPKAEECISYQIPSFKQNGLVVSFAAFKDHCSFFPGAAPIEAHKDELERFQLSKGTIRFQPDKPIPANLIRSLVKERIEQNEKRAKKRR